MASRKEEIVDVRMPRTMAEPRGDNGYTQETSERTRKQIIDLLGQVVKMMLARITGVLRSAVPHASRDRWSMCLCRAPLRDP